MAEFWRVLPSAGYKTGFIPRSDGPWLSEISGWYQCLGARAILTSKSTLAQAWRAASDGYEEIMSNGYNIFDGSNPGEAPAAITHIYLGEPFSHNGKYANHWNAKTLQQLAQSCKDANPKRKLAIGELMGPGASVPPSPGLYGYISDIIAATFSTLRDDLLIMPMHHYTIGWSPSGQGDNVGTIYAWWDSLKAAFPLVKFAPWIAATRGLQPESTEWNRKWIKDLVSHAKSMGWNKVYFYLDDGLESALGVRTALLDTGWAYRASNDAPQNGCAHDIGVGDREIQRWKDIQEASR